MSTGIETWNMNLLDIGPMYPFPGTEVVLALIGIATWIIWHVLQIRAENRIYEEEEKHYEQSGEALENAMSLSSAETLVETLKAHGSNVKR